VRRVAFLSIELLRNEFGDRRRNVASSQRDGADRVDDLHRLALLVQVAARALADQVHGVLLLGIAREDQDADVGRLRADHRERVDAALARHRQVHDDHVELGGANQVDGLAPAGGFTDHPQVHHLGQELLEPRPHDGVVIDDTYLDNRVVHSGNPLPQQPRSLRRKCAGEGDSTCFRPKFRLCPTGADFSARRFPWRLHR
jgi:hypothetical protein